MLCGFVEIDGPEIAVEDEGSCRCIGKALLDTGGVYVWLGARGRGYAGDGLDGFEWEDGSNARGGPEGHRFIRLKSRRTFWDTRMLVLIANLSSYQTLSLCFVEE